MSVTHEKADKYFGHLLQILLIFYNPKMDDETIPLAPSRCTASANFVFLRIINSRSEYIEIHYVEGERAWEHMFARPVLMIEELARFISEKCRCHFCHTPIENSLIRCKCGKQERGVIRVDILASLVNTELMPLLAEQERRAIQARKAHNRKSKLRNAGAFSKQEIDQLLELQECSCFYCVRSFETEGKVFFHIDHYLALANYGKNDVSNLVLACKDCNIKKGIKDATTFTKSLGKTLSLEEKAKAKRIRNKVRQLHKKYQNPGSGSCQGKRR